MTISDSRPSKVEVTNPRPPDHDERMRAARAVAGWHLGYSSWADQLINAYWSPDEALARLKVERDR